MAKDNKKTMYIIAAVVAIVILLVIFMQLRKPAEIPEAPAEVPAAEPEPELPEVEVATDYIGEGEMISQVACIEGKISGKLTNVGDETLTVGKTMTIQLRGMNVLDPGCDATELASGESTTCMNLNGFFPVVSGQNEIVVRASGGKEGKATVTCE